MMAKMKTATATAAAAFKRSRKSPTVTPLTRQVMTKSIHRAILEYQHTQGLGGASPKSPLDLRVRAAIYRGRNGTPINGKCLIKTEERHDKSSSTTTKTTVTTTTITNTQDHSSRINTLETVYEQEKDTNSEAHEPIESRSLVRYVGTKKDMSLERLTCDPIAETPNMLSHKKSIETMGGSENCDNDIWYTPKEYIQTNMIENIEVILKLMVD